MRPLRTRSARFAHRRRTAHAASRDRASAAVSVPLALDVAAALFVPASSPIPLGAQAGGRTGSASGDALALAVGGLSFREIGPTIVGGRIADLAVVESEPRIFYVGTATGGVWKTVNGGNTFEAIFTDRETSSIGDVTVAPSNPNVVWVGTGEPQNRQSSPWGNGVYRSLDGGRAWTHLGLEATHHIARIVVHPTDPDVAYVAAVGRLWGPNEERGVYRTTDGGRTWEKVLYVDENTGAIDLVMDPRDPRTLFAATYQRRRTAWGFNGGGPGSGIHRTLDGGETWRELTEGLPPGDKGRIGVDVYRGDPDIVCAVVEADPRAPGQGFGEGPERRRNGVYCSTDRGDTWERRSATNNRPMYYSQIRIDPSDPERIYLGGARLYRSSDGGRTFTDDAAEGVHLDHHALWIDPADSNHMLLGSDGGVSVTRDRGERWYQLRNLPVAQFYEVSADGRDPYHVCGGLQDNGSWCAPSDTRSNQGIRPKDWYNVGSGDGFFTVPKPDEAALMFAESQGGNLTLVDLATMERARIRPEARPLPGGEERELRWNWNAPVLVSAHDPNTVYAGANVLFRSRDLGWTWEEVSPDLTHALDRETLDIMGVPGSEPQMSLNDGTSSYGNLTAIAESPLDADVLYTGSDDGRLHVTRDGGATWTDVTGNVSGLPPRTYVTRIVASHGAAGTVFAAFDGHRNDDFRPYVYRSDDFGGRWRPIVDGLPETSVNALAQHPRSADLLFAGNEVGAYVSVDAGGAWVPMAGGLPTVPVDDVEIHARDNDVILGTHGRGIWILDDAGPLEALTLEVLASAAHLFDVRRATSYNRYTPQGWTPGVWAADGPEAGARIRFWLGEETDTARLTVSDAMGIEVRELGAPGSRGLHEVVWDLRLVDDAPDGEPMDPGPRVLPGTYLVRLESGSHVVEEEVEVRLDPRVTIADAELLDRQQAMLDSYQLSGPVERAEEALDAARERLRELRGAFEERDDEAPAELSDEVRALLAGADTLADELGDASTGATVWRRIEGVHRPPTADQLWWIERSWTEVPPLIERVNELATRRLPELEARLDRAGVGPGRIEAVPVPRRGGAT